MHYEILFYLLLAYESSDNLNRLNIKIILHLLQIHFFVVDLQKLTSHDRKSIKDQVVRTNKKVSGCYPYGAKTIG